MWIDLLKTWLIELPILLLFLHKYDRPVPILLLGALISASTWPFLVYYRTQIGGNIVLLELVVAFVESFWVRFLWNTSWPLSLLIGFTCNAISFGLGWLGWV
ncbi:hypothetical protein [Spirosoma endbachense]|uniref:Uncharacterized protein n=1 Tax=Spirosoma endbachense TaxID=2666025 RepID=A0A6P1VP84_9BACT|nr:hypothetical protein [Spirosoma endbachense]QHV94238.1 hypothetical protein GJR95_03990 [Spirosoma endbachense]